MGVSEMGLIQNIREEIQIIKERDPAIHSSMEVFFVSQFQGHDALPHCT